MNTPIREISIRRNADSWLMIENGVSKSTPWRESADAVSVATWIKATIDGVVRVNVDHAR